MNILYTESSPNIGGQELQAIAQMVALKQAGHRVVLACRQGSGIAEAAARQSIRVVYVPFRNSLHCPSVCVMRRLIVTFRPEIAVCHSGHDSNITGLVRALLPGRVGRFAIIRQKTYLTRKMRMFSLNNLCDVVVVPGKDMQERLVQAECLRSVAVVPPGFDFAGLRQEQMQPVPGHIRYWLASRKEAPVPVIVQVGMLRPEKGYDFMLKVFYRLKQGGRRFYWLTVGGGKREEEERLRAEVIRLGMEDCVLMCGQLTPVAPLWQLASLMVMPSRSESFGMAIVEAAVCGVPVMASNVGGIPSVIQHGRNGTLLPPDDEQAWVDALNAFLDGPEKMLEMAEQAREDMLARYSIDSTVNRLLELGKRYRYIRWGWKAGDCFY